MKILSLLFVFMILIISFPVAGFGGQIDGILYIKTSKNAVAKPFPNKWIQIELTVSEQDIERAYVKTSADGKFKTHLRNIGSCKFIVEYRIFI